MVLYWIVTVGVFASIILYLLDLHPLSRWASYTALALLILYLAARILMPLILLAAHMPPDRRRMEMVRRIWSESKHMMTTLGLQSAIAFASILIHILTSPNQVLTLALFALNTYMAVRLVAECHGYMGRDRGMAFSVMFLGIAMYFLYSLTLLGEMG